MDCEILHNEFYNNNKVFFMWMIVAIVIVIVIVFAMIFITALKRKQTAVNKPAVRQRKSKNAERYIRPSSEPKNQYHAISICCEKHACKAVLDVQGERYLATEAPTLPLAACDLASCRCRYEHHDDRRSDNDDRRLPFGISQDLHGLNESERREKKDRRKN